MPDRPTRPRARALLALAAAAALVACTAEEGADVLETLSENLGAGLLLAGAPGQAEAAILDPDDPYRAQRVVRLRTDRTEILHDVALSPDRFGRTAAVLAWGEGRVQELELYEPRQGERLRRLGTFEINRELGLFDAEAEPTGAVLEDVSVCWVSDTDLALNAEIGETGGSPQRVFLRLTVLPETAQTLPRVQRGDLFAVPVIGTGDYACLARRPNHNSRVTLVGQGRFRRFEVDGRPIVDGPLVREFDTILLARPPAG